jgi:hypothetical protein
MCSTAKVYVFYDCRHVFCEALMLSAPILLNSGNFGADPAPAAMNPLFAKGNCDLWSIQAYPHTNLAPNASI